MTDWQGKRYWLIGASEGLGRELAKTLSRVGCELVVSARSEDRLTSLVDELPGKARAVTIDVADMDSVKAAAQEVGKIDGMVYCAGVYWPMKATEWDNEKATMMAEVNYLGASRVVGEVIGDMVARDAGHIVLTGSLSAFRGLPGAIGYTASKAGMLGLAESMYMDLRTTGVKVQVVNPGFIDTRLTQKNDFHMPFMMQPEEAAREVFEHMTTDGFKKDFPTMFASVFRLSQFLPDWAYYRLFNRG